MSEWLHISIPQPIIRKFFNISQLQYFCHSSNPDNEKSLFIIFYGKYKNVKYNIYLTRLFLLPAYIMDSSTLTPWMEIIYLPNVKTFNPSCHLAESRTQTPWGRRRGRPRGCGGTSTPASRFCHGHCKYILSQRSQLISSQLVFSPGTLAGGWAAPPPPPPRRTPPA